ncbi:MAG: DinB superfamily protein [Ignavibacteria bacterium GWB2_35_6b]|nr:MAG: DinB superfamily protein [Ignavibacteria bacterium GWB2_35_6b]
MLNQILLELFERDLNKLKTEISSYKNENNLWLIEKSISNSAGNLCLHLLGNLNHFIGAVLGSSGYIREREKEFSDKNIPREKLISEIEKLLEIIKQTVGKLNQEDFEKTYPINVFQKEMTAGFFMIHLATHLNYHLGQINYHRRLIDN